MKLILDILRFFASKKRNISFEIFYDDCVDFGKPFNADQKTAIIEELKNHETEVIFLPEKVVISAPAEVKIRMACILIGRAFRSTQK